jgi:hypothetical protein
MHENRAADNLSMIEEGDEIGESTSSIENKLVIMRLPNNAILEGNMLKLSSKDALEVIANLAVQVALGEN